MVGAVFLAVLAVGPRRAEAAARLAVGKQRGRQLADGLHVEIAERAAAGVGDEARVGIDLRIFVVPQAPQIEQALLLPHDVGGAPGPADWGCAADRGRWRRESSPGNARSSTCREPAQRLLKMPSTLYRVHDLSCHFGHELEVVRAERAGHPQLRDRPVAALLAVARRPRSNRDARRKRPGGRRADRCARSRPCPACGSRPPDRRRGRVSPIHWLR